MAGALIVSKASFGACGGVAALIILAMVTRVSADWMPDLRLSHYAYAGLAWAAAALIWVAYVLPGVRHPDD